jgi:hypothetical protein
MWISYGRNLRFQSPEVTLTSVSRMSRGVSSERSLSDRWDWDVFFCSGCGTTSTSDAKVERSEEHWRKWDALDDLSMADSLRNGLLWFWWSNTPRPSKLLWRQTAQQHLSQDRSYPWPWHAMATRLRFGYAFVGFLLKKLSFEYFDFIWIWSNNLTSSDTQLSALETAFIHVYSLLQSERMLNVSREKAVPAMSTGKVRRATCWHLLTCWDAMESDARRCSSWKSWNPDRYAAQRLENVGNWAKDGKEQHFTKHPGNFRTHDSYSNISSWKIASKGSSYLSFPCFPTDSEGTGEAKRSKNTST